MGKSKLQTALAKHQGTDFKVKKQEKFEKEARKRQAKRDARKAQEQAQTQTSGLATDTSVERSKAKVNERDKESEAESKSELASVIDLERKTTDSKDDDGDDDNEDDDDFSDRPTLDLSRLEDSESDVSSDEENDRVGKVNNETKEEDEDDIPLSDLDSVATDDRGDIIPHQRLTINNTAALTAALKRIQLPYSKLAFSEHQALTTDEAVDIPDVEDDLNRELSFYKQCLCAVKDARGKLKKEGVPFSRPVDYFAEMVKSDEHMGKIKQRLMDSAAEKKAAAEARKQRDLKKFGKQVQVAKLQERAKEKRDTLERINLLKRKRSGADITATNEQEEEEDLFDVAVHKEEPTSSDRHRGARDRAVNSKRQKKDQKYGFGGKKRHAKSNDAISSADGRDFASKGGRGKKGGGVSKRPGKSRRAKMG